MEERDQADTADPLQQFRIPHLPSNFYYIPNFVTAEEEASILQKIPSRRWVTLSHRRLQAHPSTLTKNNTLLAAPLPTYLANPVVDRFKTLGIFLDTPHQEPNHVLINEYRAGEGIMPHEDGSAYARVVATVSLGASVCLEVCEKVDGGEEREVGGMDGDEAPRADQSTEVLSSNPPPLSPVPQPPKHALPTRILQEPRSLLITMGPAYTELLHGIAPVAVDENLNQDTVANWALLGEAGGFEKNGGRNVRGTRVSLTYRDVLRVSKAAGKVFGGLGRR
ncbi:alkB, alkylation repair protein 6 [Melanomma pulvis-pyrius CBS 109.77]|uniref:AlkB, alkylation repair protein 6 n=1 Tax=Melanomma pulvis-pyrius CBS 109.77 TaxID=1314802 RepID=A0A6A6XD43_9PLEO|nr:alkB, alkylation repair protein 6 [Melanomma pulvis-pyrius CBS 109.77]